MTVKLTAEMRALAAALQTLPTRMWLAAGARAVEATIRRHFRALPSRSGFFKAQVAEGKVQTSELTETHAKVTVDSRELAHYIVGGPVRPLPGRRALALPLTDEARAAGNPSAGRIPDLVMIKRKGHKPVLAVHEGDSLKVHYVLVGGVTHRAHPDAWPAVALKQAASSAIQAAMRRA